MATAQRALREFTSERITVPENRGRLLTAEQVAVELFSGTVNQRWVRRNVPGKIALGHSTVRWYEYDVQVWIVARETDSTGERVTL